MIVNEFDFLKYKKDYLVNYKYSGSDKSQLYKYIYSPIAQFLVDKLIPESIAPNLITVFAFFLITLGHLFIFITSGFNFNDNKIPNWTVYYFSIMLIVYLILDNADGKQARKTGNSSPLGLLFDHGCDSINTSLSTIAFMKVLGLNNYLYIFISLVSTNIGFIICTLEEYYTGSLDLGYINPVNEGTTLAFLILLEVAIFGNNFWKKEAFSNIKYNELLVILVSIFSLITIITSWIKMLKKTTFFNIIKNLLSIFYTIFVFGISIYLLKGHYQSNTIILLLCYIFSLIYSRITIMVQIRHICDYQLNRVFIFPWAFNTITLILTLAYSDNYSSKYFLYWMITVVVIILLYYLYFTGKVCLIISDLLGIKIFKVKKKINKELI